MEDFSSVEVFAVSMIWALKGETSHVKEPSGEDVFDEDIDEDDVFVGRLVMVMITFIR